MQMHAKFLSFAAALSVAAGAMAQETAVLATATGEPLVAVESSDIRIPENRVS